MAKPTSSANRSKRKTNKPVTKGQNPQRANRQAVSQAKVTSAEARLPGPRSAGINQGKGAGRGRVTGTLGRPKPATPAKVTTGKGVSGSSMKQDAQSWQRMNQSASAKAGKAAEAKPRTPAPGTGDVVKQAMQRGQAAKAKATVQRMNGKLQGARAMRGGLAASAVNALLNTPTEIKKAQRLLKDPKGVIKEVARNQGITMLDRKPQAKKPEKAGPAAPARIANAPKAPKLPSPKETTGQAFDKAFKAARKDGKKEFTWRGKRYTTEMK